MDNEMCFICSIPLNEKPFVASQKKLLQNFCDLMDVRFFVSPNNDRECFLSFDGSEYELHLRVNALTNFAAYHQLALNMVPSSFVNNFK